ncbi:hypothetical protein HYS10_00365 [Candidatus Collierbacteria bacterium]|nr:hypothetical protein [Candidatus Collierbacteria bacterium]
MSKQIITDVFGYGASMLGTIVFLPQVIQIWKSKQTRDVSLLSFSLIAFGTEA